MTETSGVLRADQSLDLAVQRLVALHEVQNLFGRFLFLHAAGLDEETAACFAQETPGVAAEFPSIGIYDGVESVRRFYIGAGRHVEGEDRLGHLHLHTLTTPIVEVAGDGRTAQGVWVSPGVETTPRDGEVSALWHWIKYGVDFVREPAGWRMWHLHIYGIFSVPPGESWAVSRPHPDLQLPEAIRPDRPSSSDWSYAPDRATENVPAPPAPYETWNDSQSYVSTP